MMNDRFINVPELAEFLAVPESWVYAQTRIKGPDAIPMLKIGKYCRFKVDAVMEWLESQNERQS